MIKTRKTLQKSTSSGTLSLIAFIRASLTVGILLCLGVYFSGRVFTRELPPQSEIVIPHNLEPRQSRTTAPEFSFSYKNTTYIVDPKAEYDISGLVVSHNNILAWWDIYHDENSVDIKDVCLVWGNNAAEDVYQNMNFWNESVSCHAEFKNRNSHVNFSGQALSNNHLLTADPLIQDKIRQIRVGDQIQMKGFLVNYYNQQTPEFVRKSSLTRTDTAGFACEVMYVTDLQFLKQSPRFWHTIYELSRAWFFPLLFLKLFTFLLFPWIEFKLT